MAGDPAHADRTVLAALVVTPAAGARTRGQRMAVTGAGSMSSKDWFSPAMAHTKE